MKRVGQISTDWHKCTVQIWESGCYVADRRAILSDIRDWRTIEQDADMVMFLYRDEYYNEDSKFKGVKEVTIGKQRNELIKNIILK